MLQRTKLLLLLGLAAALSLASQAGFGGSAPATVSHARAVLEHDLARAAVLVAVDTTAWAVSAAGTVSAGGNAESGDAADDGTAVRRGSRPLMPFYSFASMLPRPRGA